MNFLTPAEVAQAASKAGATKAKLPFGVMFALGILAGVYIGFGANLATVVGSVWPADLAGLSKFFFGAVFSVGLMLVVIGGAELFTGNNMFLPISCWNGEASWGGLLYNWAVVYISNFVGSVLLVYIVFFGLYYVGSTDAAGNVTALSAIGTKAVAIAKGKIGLDWGQAFFRGIGCNWLVCMAVWLALASKDVVGKIFSCFFPIMAFVTSGFEHCVANMYFVPMGITIAQSAPEAVAQQLSMNPDAVVNFFTYGNFIMNNLIPVTLGNIVGGGLFVAGFYYFIYLRPAKQQVSTTTSMKG
ncbi:MAG: formate/nitrite transporter family protein [Syntrophomonadaceae bacterium]|nr:formate/nitrite transporter family protein [Syntrophomonadaceae bacterium]